MIITRLRFYRVLGLHVGYRIIKRHDSIYVDINRHVCRVIHVFIHSFVHAYLWVYISAAIISLYTLPKKKTAYLSGSHY